jgi:hypothetical protein
MGLVVYFLYFRFQLGEHSFHVTLRILVDIDWLTENILARHGQVDEGLTAKVAINELLTKFETKQRATTKCLAMRGFSVGIQEYFLNLVL